VHCCRLDVAESTARDTRVQGNFDLTMFLRKSSVLHVMPSIGNPITGITVLGSRVFVVYDSSYVYVYDSASFTSMGKIKIRGSEQLGGIVSCSHNNCLYASDITRNTIYRYDLSDTTTTHWSVKGDCPGLSVNKRYNLLVILSEKNRIREYTTYGNLFKEVRLQSSLVFLKHCVQMSSGNFVVSQARNSHRICIVDVNGRIIKSYGDSLESGVGQLDRPCQLVVDTHDNILVADSGNFKCQMFSPTLTHLGDITIPRHQLKKPYTLHLDKDSNRLYIGELYGGHIIVLTSD